ncbi:hypothetical protein DPMN_088506 [Dreissena polymorpha]|uniref:Uncharacterized protein n=1 Tax=Dreissena polymorpha TaxID=45954 RepID=A0A9D4KVZ3_DREPO|nr:hypothetical protein DPMN_088506 [Dreissena polymorpha]
MPANMKRDVKVDLPVTKRSLRAPSATDKEQQKQNTTISRSRSRSPSASKADLHATPPPTKTHA